MHWTPGWGNLATVAVAFIGIAASVWWNKRILREANRRFAVERTERVLERQRSAIVGLLSTYQIWNQAAIDEGYPLAHRETGTSADPFWRKFASVTHPFNSSLYRARLALSDCAELSACLDRIVSGAKAHVALLLEVVRVPDGRRTDELYELGQALEAEVELFWRVAEEHLSEAAPGER